MENISKFLGMAFNVTVFFLAITILYVMSRQYDKLVETSMDNEPVSAMMYESEPIDKDNHVTRAEITALLMERPDYDIEIIDISGSFTVLVAGFNPVYIGSYPLLSNSYEKSYLYNMDGSISRIVFRYVP